MSEQAGLAYGDASDGDDTSSEVEDGGGDLRYYVPALRENSIADTHCVLREARKWRVRALGELEPFAAGRRTVRRRTMTKYEFTRIRGMRVAQLENGALPLVQRIPDDAAGGGAGPRTRTVCEQIFDEEARRRRLPYIIKREYHDGKAEYIRAHRLDYSRWLNYES